MQINFTVKYVDGSAAGAVASVVDQVAFEREHDKSIAAISSDFRLTDICWLAWHSLHRTSKTTESFDTWLERVEEVVIGEAEIVPLETAVPTG
jgi:hypothetical protein